MVCWLTLQIFAASPVVNTVFIRTSTPAGSAGSQKEVRAPAVRPSRRGPESVRESLTTGSLAPRRDASVRAVAQVGEGGRVVRAGRLWQRSKMEGSNHLDSIITRGGVRSTRRAHSAGLTRFSNSRSVARSASLAGICRHSRRPYASDQPARLARVATSASCRLGQIFHRLPSPRRLHQFAIFPHRGQMVSRQTCLASAGLAASPGEFRHAATAGCGSSPPHPPRRGYSGYPAFPRGQTPHSDSFQIKQQHCEVRRGDAADAARLAEAGRPDPASASRAPRRGAAARRRSRSAAGCACPPSAGTARPAPPAGRCSRVLRLQRPPARPRPAARPTRAAPGASSHKSRPVDLRSAAATSPACRPSLRSCLQIAAEAPRSPCSFRCNRSQSASSDQTRRAGRAASGGGRRCRAAAAGGTRPATVNMR